MTADPFDEVLDRSAPRVAECGPELDELLVQMVQEAREIALQPHARRRRRNIGIAAALAGVLVVGGGGVAVASGLVAWPSGYETPDNQFAFTLPSGRACEVRLVIGSGIEGAEKSAKPEGEAPSAEVQRAQELTARWLHETDLLSTFDFAASQKAADEILDAQEVTGSTVLIGDDGWLTDARVSAYRASNADDRYAFAADRALRAAMQEHLRSAGVPESAWTFGSAGGVKCAAE